ncbi:MAG: hypothetical protein ABR562_06935, partial [Thermoplasmatota archaeon]
MATTKEAGSEATEGPAVLALRKHLRDHRPRLPPVLRLSLILSAACAAAMLAIVAVGFVLDRQTGLTLLEYLGLQTVSGPQAATLFVFTAAHPPLGLPWVLAMTSLNMAATLFLIVPLAYRGFERLRDNRFVGGLLRSTERYSVKHRKFLARWGLFGLVLVTLAAFAPSAAATTSEACRDGDKRSAEAIDDDICVVDDEGWYYRVT